MALSGPRSDAKGRMNSEYNIFNGSDPDIAKWEPKRSDDEYQSQNEHTLGQWLPVGGNGEFLAGFTYRRRKIAKTKFEYPRAKM